MMMPDATTQAIAALRDEIAALRNDNQELKGMILSLSPQDEFLNHKEAAAFLNVHERTLRRYTDQGLIQSYRPSGKAKGDIRYRKSDLLGATPAKKDRGKRKTSAEVRKLL